IKGIGMKINVLIVEDEPTMRVVIKKTVLEIDADIEIGEIYEAENGKAGIEVLEKNDVDIILVDIYMPIMDGLDMLDYIYDHPGFDDIPAIVISTENDEKRINAIQRKGLGFVPKPLTHKFLEGEIKKILKKNSEQV